MLNLEPGAERHPSRVEEVTAEYLFLAMPMSKSIPIILFPGTRFYGRVIVDRMAWQFSSTFVDKRLLPIPVWIATPPTDIRKIQLRAFVRIDSVFPMEVQIINNDINSPYITVTAKDLSGGGVQFIGKQPFHHGTRTKLVFEFPETGRLELIGEVVREEQLPDRSLWATGIKFVEILERDRDKIIKYIFRKQCERRQKGF